MGTIIEQQYKANENDENIPSKFEGKHIELLEAYEFEVLEPIDSDMWSTASLEITEAVLSVLSEEAEIKA
jgi:hypothetical protein